MFDRHHLLTATIRGTVESHVKRHWVARQCDRGTASQYDGSCILRQRPQMLLDALPNRSAQVARFGDRKAHASGEMSEPTEEAATSRLFSLFVGEVFSEGFAIAAARRDQPISEGQSEARRERRRDDAAPSAIRCRDCDDPGVQNAVPPSMLITAPDR